MDEAIVGQTLVFKDPNMIYIFGWSRRLMQQNCKKLKLKYILEKGACFFTNSSIEESQKLLRVGAITTK
jgi:hypothetical protein